MDILICTTAFETAVTGAAGIAKILGGWELRNTGHRVHVLSEDCNPARKNHHMCAQKFWSRIPVMNYYFKSRRYGKCLKKLLRNRSYDVIYFNDIWLAHGARRLISGLKGKIVTVAFMHDDNTMDMPGAFQFNGASCSYLMRWWMERSVVKILNSILVNSEYLKARVEEKYRLDSIAVRRLYYSAHDYAKMAFRPESIDPDKPIRILFVKNDFIRGGLEDLLYALASLPQYQFDLTIVGPSAERISRRIKPALLKQENVRIDCKGPVTSWPEMLECYYAHDLLCIPSRKEALGLANAEALACGTAVVSTTAGGIPEVLKNGENGYLCEPGKVKELAGKITECIMDDNSTRVRTEAGRAFVLGRFGLDKMFGELEQILHESIAKTRQEYAHAHVGE